MSWVAILAIYFILWWVVLFAMLPFGLKTQEEDGEVTLGTVASAPRAASHMIWALLRTTIVSAVIFACFYVAVVYYGFSFNDIPRIGPAPR